MLYFLCATESLNDGTVLSFNKSESLAEYKVSALTKMESLPCLISKIGDWVAKKEPFLLLVSK